MPLLLSSSSPYIKTLKLWEAKHLYIQVQHPALAERVYTYIQTILNSLDMQILLHGDVGAGHDSSLESFLPAS